MTAREQALSLLEALLHVDPTEGALELGELRKRVADVHQALYESPEPDPQANALAAKVRTETIASVEVMRHQSMSLPDGYFSCVVRWMNDPNGQQLFYCGIAPDGSVSS